MSPKEKARRKWRRKVWLESAIIDCACGCGQRLKEVGPSGYKRRFINHHGMRCLSEETRKRLSEAQRKRTDNKLDLTGQKYGRLTVLRRLDDSRVEALCECGTTTTPKICNIRSGTTKSCGCLVSDMCKQRALPDGQAQRVGLLRNYKNQCMQTGRTWDLSDEQAFELFKGNCFYCGGLPEKKQWALKASSAFLNGIDRVDNTRGYTLDNVVSCCKTCNRFKGSRSGSEFTALVTKIYLNLSGQP